MKKQRHLYLFGNTEHKWYKLGVSYSPESRMDAFQEFLPFPVELIAAVRFTWLDGFRAFEAEKCLQQHYAGYRQRGEWFRDLPVEAVVTHIKKLAKAHNAN